MAKKAKFTVDPKVKNHIDKKHDGGDPGWQDGGSGPAAGDIVGSGEFAWTETNNPGYCFWMRIFGTWYKICA
jgi:hypothetical protein